MEELLNKSNKFNKILEVAQKYFGLYGVESTSMREIASELNLSKASLYYYFPDKESLYKAVVEKEHSEFISNISLIIDKTGEPESLLIEYVTARLIYFRSLLNLSRLRLEAYSDLKPLLRESLESFRQKEKSIIRGIFEKGISQGRFFMDDTDLTASLFLDLLKGLRVSVLNEKKLLLIEQEEYDQLLEKTRLFTEIFVKGLKVK